jgi:uncharacterized protein YqjF (DUF2071 family)
MLNYQVDPEALRERLPRGTELDDHRGRHFVSVVGFLFLGTKVRGLPIPFHRDFFRDGRSRGSRASSTTRTMSRS